MRDRPSWPGATPVVPLGVKTTHRRAAERCGQGFRDASSPRVDATQAHIGYPTTSTTPAPRRCSHLTAASSRRGCVVRDTPRWVRSPLQDAVRVPEDVQLIADKTSKNELSRLTAPSTPSDVIAHRASPWKSGSSLRSTACRERSDGARRIARLRTDQRRSTLR